MCGTCTEPPSAGDGFRMQRRTQWMSVSALGLTLTLALGLRAAAQAPAQTPTQTPAQPAQTPPAQTPPAQTPGQPGAHGQPAPPREDEDKPRFPAHQRPAAAPEVLERGRAQYAGLCSA